jgi:hypothetical protein
MDFYRNHTIRLPAAAAKHRILRLPGGNFALMA